MEDFIVEIKERLNKEGVKTSGSVKISEDGSTLLYGQPDEELAFIFTYQDDKWVFQQELLVSDRVEGDWFGFSVSLSSDGNTALIGAERADPKGADSGAAYIYTRSGSTWTQQAKIFPTDGVANDRFGYSVSLSSDGNTALIGAVYADPKGTDSGAAYIFTRSGSTWTQQAKIFPADGVANDWFGWSVSLSSDGNTALIGAVYASHNGTSSGAAYIYTRSGSTWTQQAKLFPADGVAYDNFGYSVSLSSDGNTALIGAYVADPKGADSGAAYVFTRSGSTWTQQAKIFPADGVANDRFAYSVSLSSDGTLAKVQNYFGKEYVFTLVEGKWTESPNQP